MHHFSISSYNRTTKIIFYIILDKGYIAKHKQDSTGGNMKRLSVTPIQKCNMVGTKLRQFRTEQNLSQQALSDRLETEAVYICRGSISRIEDGSRTVTDLELYGLSKVLRKPIADFFEDYPSF